jgi:alpha-glucosidase
MSTLAVNATHHGGYSEFDAHNLFGTMEEITTHAALKTLRPGQRPFIIGRSTFAGAGKYTGHWVSSSVHYRLWSSLCS